MALTWLHLSDFHIREGDGYDRNVVLNALVQSVGALRERGRRPDVVFATGDIGFSGKAAEYAFATAFFDALLAAAGLDRGRLFVIPGNHDVDRALGIGLVRSLTSREQADDYFAPDTPKPHLTQKQRAFTAWHRDYFAGVRDVPDSTCAPVEVVEAGGVRLGVLAINSALFCQGDDDHAHLWVGRREVERALGELRALDTDVRAALIHHPLEWLNGAEHANVRSLLADGVDVVLRGHLHETDVARVASPQGGLVHLAAGAAYQTREWPNRAMYVTVDGGSLEVFPIRFEDAPRPLWTVDPSVFPEEPGYTGRIPLRAPAPTVGDVAPPRTSARRIRFGLPIPAAFFTGRDDDLAALERAFAEGDRAAISGLGGVGKTQLALRYVHKHLDEHDVVAWIRAEDGGVRDLARLALDLGISADGLTPVEQAQRAVAWLARCEERWLLILDNLAASEQLAGCCPSTGNGLVLVTSRHRGLAQFAHMHALGVFDDDAGEEFLATRAQRLDDRAGARRLAQALGGLPLALGHAGAYCAEGASFAEYQEQLSALPARELFDSQPELFYERTVASTWQVSIDAAAAHGPLAPRVLALVAWLGPDRVPIELFASLLEGDESALKRKALRDTLSILHRYSLAEVDASTVSVHRLLQKVVRDDAVDRADFSSAVLALDALAAAFPDDAALPESWPRSESFVAHVMALAETAGADLVDRGIVPLVNAACEYLIRSGDTRRATACSRLALGLAETLPDAAAADIVEARVNLARAHSVAGRIREAIADGETALAEAERLLGARDGKTLAARGWLGGFYQAGGRTRDAIVLREAVSAESEQLRGAASPASISARADLAVSYERAGRTREARTMLEAVLADREALLGPDHPDTLNARNDVALCWGSAGRFRDATALQEAVVADRQRVLGHEHPDTLIARSNLAAFYESVGRIAEAIALQLEVLGHRERLLGPEHPDTLTGRNNLASSLEMAGRTREAIELQETVVADSERVLGVDHNDTLSARNNLASFYESAGLTSRAIELQERVLADRELLLGAEHPDTLRARNNVASFYQSMGRIRESLAMQVAVVADSERLLGPEHPSTLAARGNLASCFWSAGHIHEALRLQEVAVADSERLLGAEHPDTLRARNNLGSSYDSAGRYADALSLLQDVLADRERVLGADHPDTINTLGNLASSLRSAGRNREALELQERVAAERERVLGPLHPDTLAARGNLGTTYQSMGQIAKAIALHEEVLADQKRVLLGAEHPESRRARNNLASAYRAAGRTRAAIALQEAVLAENERLLGPEHPETLTTRNNLAASYASVDRTLEAIALQEGVLSDRERLLGVEHPETLAARNNLAGSYRRVGRTGEAIALQESVVADSERLLGPEHPDTLAACNNLATTYESTGRLAEAIVLQEKAVAGRERVLGPEHPDTLSARANLALQYWSARRVNDAMTLLEAVVAGMSEALGAEHPATVASVRRLASWRQTKLGRLRNARRRRTRR